MSEYRKILTATSRLESERLILRKFKLTDASDVFLYASDIVVTEYLTWPPHRNKKETAQILKDYFIDKPGVYAIELKSKNICIGSIELRLVPEHDKAALGYVLNRQYWQRDFMTEALKNIVSFSFEKLKLNRLEATHYVGNEASGRVMQKSGLVYEGTGLKEVKIKDKYHDVVHYAILKKDYLKSLKADFSD